MEAGRVFRLLGTALVLLAPPVVAQPGDPLFELLGCASIDDDRRRLECFDRAAAEMLGAREGRSADANRESRGKEISGGSLLAARQRTPKEDEEGPREERVTIVEVRTTIPGRAVFVTSDGVELVHTSGASRLFLPDVPFEATVRRGAVGGLFLLPEGSRAGIRVSLRN